MNDSTLLHRQVHPSWIRHGEPTSQVFKPTPKDDGRISVYDGDQIDAKGAWLHFTTDLSLCSAGVVAVTPAECREVNLRVIADGQPYPEHVAVAFDGLSKRGIKTAASNLAVVARKRGWQYRPG